MRSVSVLLCALVALLFISTASGRELEYLKDLPFAIVKSQPQQRLVVFFFGSDVTATPVLEMVDETAEYLIGLDLPKLKHFQWVKVDCEYEENKPDCAEAGFTAGLWIFSSTPHAGIHAFSGARDVLTLSTHVRHKFLPFNEADVLSFVDENSFFDRMDKSEDDPPKPIMVKFWEAWCEHCKKLKLPYDQAATYFKDQIEFMEVECSKNADTKSFCEHNGVKSFPQLLLFDGEKKHPFDQPDRSVVSFQNFFLGTLPEERFTRIVDEEAPTPPGSSSAGETKRGQKGMMMKMTNQRERKLQRKRPKKQQKMKMTKKKKKLNQRKKEQKRKERKQKSSKR